MFRPRVSVARLMVIVLLIALAFAAVMNNARKNFEIARLSARVKEMELLFKTIGEMRERLERPADVLELPAGLVAGIGDERQEIAINFTRREGARPGMKLSIFAPGSAGVADEKPKGMVVLTQLGEPFSTARIIEKSRSLEPIRVGDIVRPPVGSVSIPLRFALVGKIDVNRDGNDDRDLLKCIIQEAGGVVDFDLPPPETGRETGTLSARIDWYVTDSRPPLQERFAPRSQQRLTAQQAQHEKRVHDVCKESRLMGIRPMPIERLLYGVKPSMSAALGLRSVPVTAASPLATSRPRRAE